VRAVNAAQLPQQQRCCKARGVQEAGVRLAVMRWQARALLQRA
jgi:hypothetical protein